MFCPGLSAGAPADGVKGLCWFSEFPIDFFFFLSLLLNNCPLKSLTMAPVGHSSLVTHILPSLDRQGLSYPQCSFLIFSLFGGVAGGCIVLDRRPGLGLARQALSATETHPSSLSFKIRPCEQEGRPVPSNTKSLLQIPESWAEMTPHTHPSSQVNHVPKAPQARPLLR